LFQHLGFPALYVPGSQTGTVLGVTEPLTTLSQMAEVGETVAKGVRGDLPVILDAGAGFGDPVHVVNAVETFEDAGITAIHIEDQFFPKRVSYHRGLEHVVPLDVYQQRLEYALKARRSRDFLIIGRNDGFRAAPDPWVPNGGSREEAVKRAHAALEVGVDVIMIIVREREDFEYFRRQVKDVPMVALMGNPALGVPDFQSLGYQIVIFPGATIQSALRGIHHVYRAVQETGYVPEDTLLQWQDMLNTVNTLLDFERKWEIESATTEKGAAPQH
jgi:methylisocitrate lyase